MTRCATDIVVKKFKNVQEEKQNAQLLAIQADILAVPQMKSVRMQHATAINVNRMNICVLMDVVAMNV